MPRILTANEKKTLIKAALVHPELQRPVLKVIKKQAGTWLINPLDPANPREGAKGNPMYHNDGNADYVDKQVDKINRMYKFKWGRKMKPEELLLLFKMAILEVGKGLKSQGKKLIAAEKSEEVTKQDMDRIKKGEIWWTPKRKTSPLPGTKVEPFNQEVGGLILGNKPLEIMRETLWALRRRIKTDLGRDPFLQELEYAIQFSTGIGDRPHDKELFVDDQVLIEEAGEF